MITDAHAHVGKGVARSEFSQFDVVPEWVIDQMDRCGVEKSVIFPVHYPIFKYGNDEVAEAVKKYPKRFIGFCGIQMNCLKHGLEDINYGFDFLGLKGAGEIKPTNLSPNILLPLMSELEKRKVVANFHTNVRVADYIAKKFPRLKVILAHMGEDNPMSISVAKERPNLYLDTSTVNFDLVKRAYQELGAEKIIFGSDSPFIYLSAELKKIIVLNLKENDKKLILSENILRLIEGDK